jgi:hypothetical protein
MLEEFASKSDFLLSVFLIKVIFFVFSERKLFLSGAVSFSVGAFYFGFWSFYELFSLPFDVVVRR